MNAAIRVRFTRLSLVALSTFCGSRICSGEYSEKSNRFAVEFSECRLISASNGTGDRAKLDTKTGNDLLGPLTCETVDTPYFNCGVGETKADLREFKLEPSKTTKGVFSTKDLFTSGGAVGELLNIDLKKQVAVFVTRSKQADSLVECAGKVIADNDAFKIWKKQRQKK